MNDAGIIQFAEVDQRRVDQRLRVSLDYAIVQFAVDLDVQRSLTMRAFGGDGEREMFLP